MLFDEEYPAVFASYLIRLRFPEDKLLPEFYWSFAQSEQYWEQARNLATGGGQPQFNGNALTEIKIPLPPLEVQREIVAEVEGYQNEIERLRAEIANQEKNIQRSIGRVFGEDSDSATGAPPSQPGATPQEPSPKNP